MDESLSWQQISNTTMSDAKYQQTLHNASPDQKAVIDKVFTHNRSPIVENSSDQLIATLCNWWSWGRQKFSN